MNEEDYYDVIWSEFDVFLYKKEYTPSRLHLPLEVEEKLTYCHEELNRDDYEFIDKPVEVYPKGYRRICRNCLKFWRESK